MAVDSLFNQTEIHEENSSADTEALNKKSRTKKEKKNNEKVKRKRKQLLEKIMVINEILKIIKLYRKNLIIFLIS